MADQAQIIHYVHRNGETWIPSITIAYVVFCKDCKHRPIINSKPSTEPSISAPRQEGSWEYDETCPYLCGDSWYNRMPGDDCFCNFGERK